MFLRVSKSCYSSDTAPYKVPLRPNFDLLIYPLLFSIQGSSIGLDFSSQVSGTWRFNGGPQFREIFWPKIQAFMIMEKQD